MRVFPNSQLSRAPQRSAALFHRQQTPARCCEDNWQCERRGRQEGRDRALSCVYVPKTRVQNELWKWGFMPRKWALHLNFYEKYQKKFFGIYLFKFKWPILGRNACFQSLICFYLVNQCGPFVMSQRALTYPPGQLQDLISLQIAKRLQSKSQNPQCQREAVNRGLNRINFVKLFHIQ